MKIIAVNASPRKNYNTSILLQKALEGAQSAGAQAEIAHLYELSFRGCVSCFACKKGRGEHAGICALRDDLSDLLQRITTSCDGLLLGSPIYLGDVTSAMRAFLERLIYPNVSYSKQTRSYFPGRIASGFIYTMGLPSEAAQRRGYSYLYESNQRYLNLLGVPSVYMTAADTYQFDDYSKYNASNIDAAHKADVRANQFPTDCEKAYDMGRTLAMSGIKD